MIGIPGVRMRIEDDTRFVDEPWTLETIRKVVDNAFDDNDKESFNLLQSFMDQANKRSLVTIQMFFRRFGQSGRRHDRRAEDPTELHSPRAAPT